jgi:hypothetical protein
MGLLLAICLVVLCAAVVLVVSGPLRRRGGGQPSGHDPLAAFGAEEARADLGAAREAKYREIRDAELDYRTGKLSEQDYRAIDAELRAEALEILDRLERSERGTERPAG